MITEWILRNLEGQPLQNAPRHDELVAAQDFLFAWGFAERAITLTYRNIIQNDNGHVSLGHPAFRTLFEDRSVRFNWNNLIAVSYRFYQSRYVRDGRLNGNYNNLHISDNIVRRAILNSDSSQRNKMRAVAFITTKIRHNLVHGTKTLPDIINQQDLLEHATSGICGLTIALGLAQQYDLHVPQE